MNYQYRYGTSTITAAKTLYASGGYPRYYSGLLAALIQGPISRFWDTAANAGVLALLGSNYYMKHLPELIKTIFSSGVAAGLRMVTTPIDTVKTTLQVSAPLSGRCVEGFNPNCWTDTRQAWYSDIEG